MIRLLVLFIVPNVCFFIAKLAVNRIRTLLVFQVSTTLCKLTCPLGNVLPQFDYLVLPRSVFHILLTNI